MGRLKEIDYLRSMFTVLMVMFHLAFFPDKHPYLKQVICIFHLLAFLLISGCLSNSYKSFNSFSTKMFWLFFISIPLFGFDPTAICFMLFGLTLSIVGSLGIAYFMDRVGMSSFLFGRKGVLVY